MIPKREILLSTWKTIRNLKSATRIWTSSKASDEKGDYQQR